jgi:hypothetical protein
MSIFGKTRDENRLCISDFRRYQNDLTLVRCAAFPFQNESILIAAGKAVLEP